MEVHHHSHGNAHKKVWKEYFWEFFMLFLAVFCGSLAELQLEHYIENQREKKYVVQMQQDLLADSISLSAFIATGESEFKRLDSLLQIFVHKTYKKDGNQAYYFARQIIRASNIVLSEGTLNQLKFAGNLRLIGKDDIAKKIMEYDKNGREFEHFLERSTVRIEEASYVLEKLFDGKVFYAMLNDNNEIIKPINNPQLISEDEGAINTVIIRLQYVKGGALRKVNMAKRLQNQCLLLSKTLKKQYRLN